MPVILVPKQSVKTCARCGVEKPLTEFYMRSNPRRVVKPKPHSYCIDCTKSIAKNPRTRKAKPTPAELVLPVIRKFGYLSEIIVHGDILIYGGIKVCIKKSRKHGRSMRVFFTDRQLAENYDMIIVIAPDGSILAYSWSDSVWFDEEFDARHKTKVLSFGRGSFLAETIETEFKKKRLEVALGKTDALR